MFAGSHSELVLLIMLGRERCVKRDVAYRREKSRRKRKKIRRVVNAIKKPGFYGFLLVYILNFKF